MGDLIKLPSTYLYPFYGTYHIIGCLGIFQVHILSFLIDCEPSEGRVWALYLSVTRCSLQQIVFLRQLCCFCRHHQHHHVIIVVS